jgi:hypothetical protein
VNGWFNRCRHRRPTAAVVEACLTEADGGRTQRRGVTARSVKPTLSSRRAGSLPCAHDDIRVISAFASHSEYVVRGPKMPIHWSPPKASLSASALASKSRAAGRSVVSHFSLMRAGRHRAHRTETSRLMFSMLAKGQQGVIKINSASVRGSRHVDARHAAGHASEPIQSPRRALGGSTSGP